MKIRLDTLMVERGLSPGRDKAKAQIMAGNVFVGGERVDKPGTNIDENAEITCAEAEPFVSRGGKKLEKALASFSIDLNQKICADIGASTGGFTDCMLQRGAAKVYAVDVGYGQLAWRLRNHPAVVNLERTNVRYITETEIPDKLDFFSVDVSFISLTLVLPAILPLLAPDAEGVCLIKPQFEAGRERVGKNGVVRDPDVQTDVILSVFEHVKRIGLTVLDLTFSPIKGPKGNIEFLLWVGRNKPDNTTIDVAALVASAHQCLDKDTP